MQVFDIAIAPGEVRDVYCQGSYVYFYSGSAGGADPTLTINADARGERILLLPGQAFRMPAGELGKRWLIGNLKGDGTIIGRIVIGDGELTDNRVSGSVEVIDGEKMRTLAGGMFSGVPAISDVSAQYGNVQLWNPAGSAKNIIVTQMNVSWSAASNAVVAFENVELSELYAHAASNKKTNGPATIGKLKVQTKASSMTAFPYGILQNLDLQAGGAQNWKVSGALVVQPGFGVTVTQQTAGRGIKSSFEWFEEPL